MKDKIKEQLMKKLTELRQQINEMETSEGKRRQVGGTLQETAKILDAMYDGVLLFDTDGKVILANRAYCETFSLDPKDVEGKLFTDIPGIEKQKEEEIKKFMPLFETFIDKGYLPLVELIIVSVDGREIPVSVTGGSIKDSEGNLACLIVVIRDTTERKKAEEEMRRALKQERQFKLETAHYFFNPLCIARGYLDLAMKKMPEKRKKDLKAAHQAIERIEKVLENILQRGEIHE